MVDSFDVAYIFFLCCAKAFPYMYIQRIPRYKPCLKGHFGLCNPISIKLIFIPVHNQNDHNANLPVLATVCTIHSNASSMQFEPGYCYYLGNYELTSILGKFNPLNA